MMTKTYKIFFAIYILSFIAFSHAKAHEFPFVDANPLYVGSRPLAMGNTFTAIADEGEAGFWNPAGLIQWQGVKLFASTKAGDRDNYAFDSKSMAYSYKGNAFFWGNKIATRGIKCETPDFTYYSLARKLSSHLAVGGSVKFKRKHPSSYYQFFGHNPSYDLGLLWKIGNYTSLSLVLQNTPDSDKWINTTNFGLAQRLFNDLLLSIDTGITSDESVSLETHVGSEYWFTSWSAIRLGLSNSDPTAGLGLRLSRIQIDYAWIRNSAGNAHFISGQIDI
ncbi:hypothetical protein GF312_02910 [Candidatus Poribacteria bacterium]|nr:hypothetical protein [Candidatus Poribacteria bacterium]